jgi:hypothetical protein
MIDFFAPVREDFLTGDVPRLIVWRALGLGSSRPRAECSSLMAGSRYGLDRSSPNTSARTCIPGNRTHAQARRRDLGSPGRER